jgi:hypothetical protein
VQNAAFRCGLIAACSVMFCLSADSKPFQHISSVVENSVGRQEHKSPDDMRDGPDTRQSERSAIVAQQEPSEPGHDQHGNRNADEGSEDRVIARQSAKAAERQADYAEFGLWVGAIAALATAWAAWAAAFAARSARDSVLEAKAANEQARVLFAAEQRPWLGIEAAKVVHFALTANPGERPKAHVTMEVGVKNFGSTPATQVFGYAEVCPFGVDVGVAAAAVREKISQGAQELEHIGRTVFPGMADSPLVTAIVESADKKTGSGYIVVAIAYRFSDGAQRGETWCNIALRYSDMPMMTFPLDIGDLSVPKFSATLLPIGMIIK